MQDGLHEDEPIDPALANLRFMIQLQLQTVSTLLEGSEGVEQEHAVLRQLLDMEIMLRSRRRDRASILAVSVAA